MAFRKKYEKVFSYNPDIVIIQECENRDKLESSLDHVDYKQLLWFGDNPHKGIGVISFQDYQIELHAKYNSEFKYIIPLSISIENSIINVYAIWAMPHEIKKSKSYVGQIWDAIHYYEKELHETSILIGDFNSHVRWDKERSPGNHSGVVSFLQYKHEDKPYHLDYCFASKSLLNKMSIELGQYKEWISLSDHMPIIVRFDI